MADLLDALGTHFVVDTADSLRQYDLVAFYSQGDVTVPGVDKSPPMTQAGKAALLEFIPTFGPTIAAIPGIISAFLVSPTIALYVAIYYLVPWLRWDRGAYAPDQAVLIDLAHRRFFFFSIEIWPHEFYYVAGLLVMAASVVAVGWVAGKIYRVGILSTGTRPSLRELARWVRMA